MPYIEIAVPRSMYISRPLVEVPTLPAEERPVSYLLETIYNGSRMKERETSTKVYMGNDIFFILLEERKLGVTGTKERGTCLLRPKLKFGLC